MHKFEKTYRVPVGLRGLATAEVAESPGSVSEHAEFPAVAKKGQQRAQSTAAQDVITALRAITSNIAESPDSLLTDIRLGASEKLDENGNSTGLNDNLGLSGRARSNVGKGPSGLELDQSVGGAKEFDEATNDAGLDNLFDRRVTLLAEQLSKLGSRLNLLIDLIREDTLDHLGEVLAQLQQLVSMLRHTITEIKA